MYYRKNIAQFGIIVSCNEWISSSFKARAILRTSKASFDSSQATVRPSTKAWPLLVTQEQAQAKVAYAGENERRHEQQNQPRHPPFCSDAQTRGIWSDCFNWPGVQNFLVLMLCFVFTQRKRRQAQRKGKTLSLCIVLALVTVLIASTPFSR